DVDDQLQSLKTANDYINSQFNEDDEDSDLSSVAADTKALKKRLSQALQSVDEAHKELENAIEKGLIDKEVEDELRGIVEKAFDDQDDLSELLSKQDDDVREKMNDQISKLPTLDEEAIEDSDLSPETKQEIKNVIKITNKYDKEFDEVQIDEQDILSDHVSALIEALKKDGVEVTDTAEIPENKKSGQIFELLDIPESFEIEHLTLTMPDKDRFDFSGSEAEEPITLPSNKEGDLEVKLTLKLDEDYEETLDSFDVYSEFTEWYWTLEQKDINDELDDEEGDDSTAYQPTKSLLVASTTTENDDKDSKSKTSENDNTDQSDDKDENKKSDNESKDDSKKESKDDKDDSDKDSSDKSPKKSEKNSEKKSEEKSDKKSKKDTKNQNRRLVRKIIRINKMIKMKTKSTIMKIKMITKKNPKTIKMIRIRIHHTSHLKNQKKILKRNLKKNLIKSQKRIQNLNQKKIQILIQKKMMIQIKFILITIKLNIR